MKLTPENIAAIEDVLTQYENGEPLKKIGSEMFPDSIPSTSTAVLTHFVAVLRELGANIDKRGRIFIDRTEYSKFRAWKTAQEKK